MNDSVLSTVLSLFKSNLLLTRKEKGKLLIVLFLQVLLAMLDLVGVALFGVLGAIAANGLRAQGPGDRVSKLLSFLNLDTLEIKLQILVIAAAACLLLVSKTLISLSFNRRALFFLSRRAALISARLIKKFLSQPITEIQSRSMHETVYSVTSGVATVTTGILGASLNIVTDISLLLIIGTGLFIVDSITAVIVICLFSSLGYLMYFFLHKRAETLGRKSSELTIRSNESIYEILVAFREAVVRNRRTYYAEVIGKQRVALANTAAEYAFLPSISKYVLEIALVFCALLMGIIQFALNDTGRALGTLVIFFAGSYRIAPAILRIQQSVVSIRTNIGIAEPTLKLISELNVSTSEEISTSPISFNHDGFSGDLVLQNISFKYPASDKFVLESVDFDVKNGTFVAFVGPSGAGKSTLADICLGVLSPDIGKVTLSGRKPIDAISRWPGAVGYVPQDVVIFNTTIKANVAIGFDESEIDQTRLIDSLRVAQLWDFVQQLPNKEDALVGDRGTKLSGGQRQRLGIARALYTNPSFLILDEATSALDGATETSVTESLHSLKGKVTLVVIAHRLSTVRAADKLIYLDSGKIISSGTFEEVRNKVPDFDRQANLMGLS
jgi:ATP-binding cassette, subfamily B, bacterial PglK